MILLPLSSEDEVRRLRLQQSIDESKKPVTTQRLEEGWWIYKGVPRTGKAHRFWDIVQGHSVSLCGIWFGSGWTLRRDDQRPRCTICERKAKKLET